MLCNFAHNFIYFYFAHQLTNLVWNIDRRLAGINIRTAGPYDLTESYVIVVDILFECSVYCSYKIMSMTNAFTAGIKVCRAQ